MITPWQNKILDPQYTCDPKSRWAPLKYLTKRMMIKQRQLSTESQYDTSPSARSCRVEGDVMRACVRACAARSSVQSTFSPLRKQNEQNSEWPLKYQLMKWNGMSGCRLEFHNYIKKSRILTVYTNIVENTATRTIIVGTRLVPELNQQTVEDIMQGKAAFVKKCVILLRRTHYI